MYSYVGIQWVPPAQRPLKELPAAYKKIIAKSRESGRLRLSEAACAKRQTNWRRVWVIGGTGARPESPGIAAVSRPYRGYIAAVIRL